MTRLILALLMLSATAAVASAQSPVPDLRGTWSGKGKVIVFGANPHHPDGPTAAGPRVREIEATHVVEGQDGRLMWGYSFSKVAPAREPFSWAMTQDFRSILGADLDGYFHITLITPDRMEKCYAHNGVSPSRSVVATCYEMQRQKK
jgi:hypothetical protein